MLGPRDQYLKEMRDKYGFHATWQPNVTLKLGDVGIINHNVFRHVTTLDKKGLKFETRAGAGAADLSYTSATGVSITASAAANVSGAAGGVAGGAGKGSLVVEFGETAGVVFQAMQTRTSTIEDQETLGKKIVAMYKDGDWNADFVVVTELVTAESLTVLISNGKKARIELTASGDVSPGVLKLADASAGLAVTAFQNIDTQIVAKKQLTPLFTASTVKRHFLRTPEFNAAGLNPMHLITPAEAKGDAGKDLYFGRVDFVDPQDPK